MAAPANKRRRSARILRRQYADDPIKEVLEAARHGDVISVLQEMSSNEQDSILKGIYYSSNYGYTAMHYAVYLTRGSCNVLSCLIGNGADVNVRSSYDCTPLMAATKSDNLDAVKFFLKHGAKVNLQDQEGKTCLHYAVEASRVESESLLRDVSTSYAPYDVLSCLLNHGADINAPTKYDMYTPLILACGFNQVNLANFLLQHGANALLKDKDGKTALHVACEMFGLSNSCDLLSCLIENGADINACRNDNCTPLMTASRDEYVDNVTFLIEHGANVHLQDKNGDTALHFAARNLCNSSEIVCALTAAGASQMCNNQGLTPLLLASNRSKVEAVEELIKSPEVKKEQRIYALELLGASMTIQQPNDFSLATFQAESQAFSCIRCGMEERFADPLHPLLKQPMEPIDAYQNQKESQSLEELIEKGKDRNALILESLVIKERILGKNNAELLNGIRCAAYYYQNIGLSTCIGLHRHALKAARSCNQSAIKDIRGLSDLIKMYENVWNDQQKQTYIVELLEQIVHEYEKRELMRKKDSKSISVKLGIDLFSCLIKVISLLLKFQYFEVDETSSVSLLMRRLCGLNPRNWFGSTLLHEAVENYRYRIDLLLLRDTMKFLLNTGFNVSATDGKGNTPLHIAVTLQPNDADFHLFRNLLEMLLDRGAHQDFVNHDGKTAMDLAQTEEARSILWEKRKLELKCISARAVKRFGLPYLGVVPKILEKYISMH